MRLLLRKHIALVVALAFLASTSACHDSRQVELAPDQVSPAAKVRIIGVTTLEGTVYHFEDPAKVENDTVVGVVGDASVKIPLKSVSRFLIEERKHNTWKTVGLVAGIVAAVAITGAVVASGTSSSSSSSSSGTGFKTCCPFFYSWDGSRWVLDAEPYPGAVTTGLERTGDVVLEHLRAVDGTYRVLMTNERPETEYTDLVSIRVVDHAPGLRVVPAEDGTLWGISAPVPPSSARTDSGRDLMLWLSASDARVFEPLPPASPERELRDTIVLTFPKPPGARTARLVANLGTSQWGGEMFDRFFELWGRELPAFYKSLDDDPRAVSALYDWNLEAELWGLKFEVEEETGWTTAGSLLGAGPLLVKERVLPIDVSRVPGDVLKIRIRPPKGYWALNSFAVDYTDGGPLASTEVPIATARDERGVDRRAALLVADGIRDEMPQGDVPVTLTFAGPEPMPGLDRTVVLRARGFYRPYLDTTREPDSEAIRAFMTEPDFGVRFGADRFARRAGDPSASPAATAR